MKKYDKLLKLLDGRKIAIAFSGGVDSSLLLYAAQAVATPLAIMARLNVMPICETQHAQQIAEQIGAKLVFWDFDQLSVPSFTQNGADRCFLCKQAMLSQLCKIAEQHGCDCVAEGSNADDLHEFRPGFAAVQQHNVLSPLAQAGLTKPEIRTLARQFGLPNFDKPAAPCLCTRIPFGQEITHQKLRMIQQAEQFFAQNSITTVRVRHFGSIAKIEVEPHDMQKLLSIRTQAVEALLQLGFEFVTLDLQGFKSGALNPKI